MTAKFGFQVTVQERAIWIFPEDIDAASAVAKAEAVVTDYLKKELERLPQTDITSLIAKLPNNIQTAVNNESNALTAKGTDAGKAKVAALMSQASVADIVKGMSSDVQTAIGLLKAKITDGIAYSWIRGAGEDPITLGTFANLLNFIDERIIKSLPSAVRPDFDVSENFDALVNGLPDPVNGAIEALKSKAVFELDGLRLKIPGKGSKEKTQFEIAMLINLVALDLILGPFQLNRLYAKLGNFGSS